MPRRKRRSFTREQKADAVRLVREVGNLAKVARDLDLTENSLRSWVKQAEIDEAPCVRVVAASSPCVVACPCYPGEPREASPWLAGAERGVPGGRAPREGGPGGRLASCG